jgi:hypothetical protein
MHMMQVFVLAPHDTLDSLKMKDWPLLVRLHIICLPDCSSALSGGGNVLAGESTVC